VIAEIGSAEDGLNLRGE